MWLWEICSDSLESLVPCSYNGCALHLTSRRREFKRWVPTSDASRRHVKNVTFFSTSCYFLNSKAVCVWGLAMSLSIGPKVLESGAHIPWYFTQGGTPRRSSVQMMGWEDGNLGVLYTTAVIIKTNLVPSWTVSEAGLTWLLFPGWQEETLEHHRSMSSGKAGSKACITMETQTGLPSLLSCLPREGSSLDNLGKLAVFHFQIFIITDDHLEGRADGRKAVREATNTCESKMYKKPHYFIH